MTMHFPFTAIIGQEAMQTALLLCAVDPGIGGVLIRGQKGTAKSTTARSLAATLPGIETVSKCPYHCDPQSPEQLHHGCKQILNETGSLPVETIPTPFVDLPLSATEDRLVGTLNLEGTLHSGQRQFEPGLLATAHRGIIYVDEVNLLPDHLVDMLLDAAASGINQVEREGLTYSHASRFILIGTMNPEEGELRPQFLDRFGLCVSISGLEDVSARSEIVSRRLAFDKNPLEFFNKYSQQENLLKQQVAGARQALNNISIPDKIINRAAEIAIRAKVHGHRAELTLVRAARALAALLDRDVVTESELHGVAGFALAHRLPGQDILSDSALENKIAGLLAEDSKNISTASATQAVDDADLMENMNFPGSAASGGMLFTYLKKKLKIATSESTNLSI